MIEPHGKDSVFFGVRGEAAEYVIEAANLNICRTDVDTYEVFSHGS